MHAQQQYNMSDKVNKRIVDLLYEQSTRLAISHPVAALIAVYWLSRVQAIGELLIWFSLVLLLSALRVGLMFAYNKHADESNHKLWLHAFSAMGATTACLYGLSALVYFPMDVSVYVVSVCIMVISLNSAAIISYGASIYATLSFVIPLSLISSYATISKGGEIGLYSAIVILFYSLISTSLIKNLNNAFKKSITLNFQHTNEIEKRKLIEQQLYDISRRDSLTGLFNRRYFDEVLEIEIGRSRRNHSQLCLMMFDIDCFKEYNDEYGHVAGDNCLIDIADIVSKLASRKGDLLARYGGEEFAIILPNIDLEGATAFAKKVQTEIQKKRIPHAASKLTSLKCVTVSVGVTNITPFAKAAPADLIKDADAALYEAKREGRNRVHSRENTGISSSF
jgi:diguanylate cyclase (GGDEF)-like protein